MYTFIYNRISVTHRYFKHGIQNDLVDDDAFILDTGHEVRSRLNGAALVMK